MITIEINERKLGKRNHRKQIPLNRKRRTSLKNSEMNFEFEKVFVKDFRKLKNKELANSIREVMKQISAADSPTEIVNLKNVLQKNIG